MPGDRCKNAFNCIKNKHFCGLRDKMIILRTALRTDISRGGDDREWGRLISAGFYFKYQTWSTDDGIKADIKANINV